MKFVSGISTKMAFETLISLNDSLGLHCLTRLGRPHHYYTVYKSSIMVMVQPRGHVTACVPCVYVPKDLEVCKFSLGLRRIIGRMVPVSGL